MENYIVIGAGISGISFCKEIRQHDKVSKITLINGEYFLPYKRTDLSKKFIETSDDSFEIFTNQDAKDLDIKIVNALCDEIFEDKHQISLDNKDILDYSKLVIAIGKDHINQSNHKLSYFAKSKQDILKLKNDLDKIKSIAIIGGGILGLEMCYALSKEGLDITVFDSSSHLLSLQCEKDYSDVIEKSLAKNNIKYHLNSMTQIEFYDNSVNILFKKDNQEQILKFDAVLSCFKYQVPQIKSNIKTTKSGGIIVDENLHCGKDIYAIGDCIVFDNEPINLWHESQECAQMLAKSFILNTKALYKKKNYRIKLDLFGDFFYSLNYNNLKNIKVFELIKFKSPDLIDLENDTLTFELSGQRKMAHIYKDENQKVLAVNTLNIGVDRQKQKEMTVAVNNGILAVDFVNLFIMN